MDGGFRGQVPGGIELINPESAMIQGGVYKNFHCWSRVLIEIRIGMIANFGIFDGPFKFRRALVPPTVFCAAILSEIEVRKKPLRTQAHIDDWIKILQTKYNMKKK